MIVDHRVARLLTMQPASKAIGRSLQLTSMLSARERGKAVHGAAVFWTETGEITVGRGT